MAVAASVFLILMAMLTFQSQGEATSLSDVPTNVSLRINQRLMEFTLTWDILNATNNALQYYVNCSTEPDGVSSVSFSPNATTLTDDLPSGSRAGATFNCCVLAGEMESQAICTDSVIPTGDGITASYVGAFVKAFATMLLVVGLLVLSLGAVAIAVISIYNKKSIKNWVQDKINLIIRKDDDDTQGEPELENYEEITHEAPGTPPEAHYTAPDQNIHEAMPIPPPPPPPPPGYANKQEQNPPSGRNLPEEIGFHVSVEQSIEESNKLDIPMSMANYEDVAFDTGLTDEAMGYLSGATYRPDYTEMGNMDHRQEKVDQSDQCTTEFDGGPLYGNSTMLETAINYDNMDGMEGDIIDQCTTEFDGGPLYGNSTMLETAINYDNMDGMEGDIIDQIDYQNVTIVRTTGEEPGGVQTTFKPHTGGVNSHSPGGSGDEIDYVSVDSYNMQTSEGDTVFGKKPDLPNSLANAGTLQIHYDEPSRNSATLSYENFDPHQCPPLAGPDNHMAKYTSGVDEYVYQDNCLQPPHMDAMPPEETEEDFYVNVEASRLQAQIHATKDMPRSMTPASDDYI